MIINAAPISANVIVCQEVLPGKDGLLSAINILNLLTIQPHAKSASFKVLTVVNGYPGDPYEHVFQIQILSLEGKPVATGEPRKVVLANAYDPNGPRTFMVITHFVLDLTQLGRTDSYIIGAYLDQNLIGRGHITLRSGILG